MLNHYVTRSRAEFLAKYKKGKLSQASKEDVLAIDRSAVVGRYGDVFVQVRRGRGGVLPSDDNCTDGPVGRN